MILYFPFLLFFHFLLSLISFIATLGIFSFLLLFVDELLWMFLLLSPSPLSLSLITALSMCCMAFSPLFSTESTVRFHCCFFVPESTMHARENRRRVKVILLWRKKIKTATTQICVLISRPWQFTHMSPQLQRLPRSKSRREKITTHEVATIMKIPPNFSTKGSSCFVNRVNFAIIIPIHAVGWFDQSRLPPCADTSSICRQW